MGFSVNGRYYVSICEQIYETTSFLGIQEHMQAPRKAYFQLPEENVHRRNEDAYGFPQVFFYGYTAILSA